MAPANSFARLLAVCLMAVTLCSCEDEFSSPSPQLPLIVRAPSKVTRANKIKIPIALLSTSTSTTQRPAGFDIVQVTMRNDPATTVTVRPTTAFATVRDPEIQTTTERDTTRVEEENHSPEPSFSPDITSFVSLSPFVSSTTRDSPTLRDVESNSTEESTSSPAADRQPIQRLLKAFLSSSTPSADTTSSSPAPANETSSPVPSTESSTAEVVENVTEAASVNSTEESVGGRADEDDPMMEIEPEGEDSELIWSIVPAPGAGELGGSDSWDDDTVYDEQNSEVVERGPVTTQRTTVEVTNTTDSLAVERTPSTTEKPTEESDTMTSVSISVSMQRATIAPEAPAPEEPVPEAEAPAPEAPATEAPAPEAPATEAPETPSSSAAPDSTSSAPTTEIKLFKLSPVRAAGSVAEPSTTKPTAEFSVFPSFSVNREKAAPVPENENSTDEPVEASSSQAPESESVDPLSLLLDEDGTETVAPEGRYVLVATQDAPQVIETSNATALPGPSAGRAEIDEETILAGIRENIEGFTLAEGNSSTTSRNQEPRPSAPIPDVLVPVTEVIRSTKAYETGDSSTPQTIDEFFESESAGLKHYLLQKTQRRGGKSKNDVLLVGDSEPRTSRDVAQARADLFIEEGDKGVRTGRQEPPATPTASGAPDDDYEYVYEYIDLNSTDLPDDLPDGAFIVTDDHKHIPVSSIRQQQQELQDLAIGAGSQTTTGSAAITASTAPSTTPAGIGVEEQGTGFQGFSRVQQLPTRWPPPSGADPVLTPILPTQREVQQQEQELRHRFISPDLSSGFRSSSVGGVFGVPPPPAPFQPPAIAGMDQPVFFVGIQREKTADVGDTGLVSQPGQRLDKPVSATRRPESFGGWGAPPPERRVLPQSDSPMSVVRSLWAFSRALSSEERIMEDGAVPQSLSVEAATPSWESSSSSGNDGVGQQPFEVGPTFLEATSLPAQELSSRRVTATSLRPASSSSLQPASPSSLRPASSSSSRLADPEEAAVAATVGSGFGGRNPVIPGLPANLPDPFSEDFISSGLQSHDEVGSSVHDTKPVEISPSPIPDPTTTFASTTHRERPPLRSGTRRRTSTTTSTTTVPSTTTRRSRPSGSTRRRPSTTTISPPRSELEEKLTSVRNGGSRSSTRVLANLPTVDAEKKSQEPSVLKNQRPSRRRPLFGTTTTTTTTATSERSTSSESPTTTAVDDQLDDTTTASPTGRRPLRRRKPNPFSLNESGPKARRVLSTTSKTTTTTTVATTTARKSPLIRPRGRNRLAPKLKTTPASVSVTTGAEVETNSGETTILSDVHNKTIEEPPREIHEAELDPTSTSTTEETQHRKFPPRRLKSRVPARGPSRT